MVKYLSLGCALAVVMVSSGCVSYSNTTRAVPAPAPAGTYYSYNASPGVSPNAGYTPQYSNETPASRYGYYSEGDYYRNYGGTYHPGPERNCPGC